MGLGDKDLCGGRGEGLEWVPVQGLTWWIRYCVLRVALWVTVIYRGVVCSRYYGFIETSGSFIRPDILTPYPRPPHFLHKLSSSSNF